MNNRRFIIILNVVLLIILLFLHSFMDWGHLLLPIYCFLIGSLISILFNIRTTEKAPQFLIATLFALGYGILVLFMPSNEILGWVSASLGSLLGLILGGLLHKKSNDL